MSTKKLAVVTGGTRGIGFGIANALAENFDVALIYFSDDEVATQAKTTILKNHPNADIKIYRCDVGDYAQSCKVYADIKEAYKRTVDILVTAAGKAVPALSVIQPAEIFENLMRTNYMGVVYWNKLIVTDMMKKKFGRIINITSNSAGTSNQGLGSYSPTKIAVEKFSSILGGEIAKYGVTVNTIRPGVVMTRMSEKWFGSLDKKSWQYRTVMAPSYRLVEMESIVKTVCFLLDSPQINCTSITIDGGNSNFTSL